VIHDAHAGMQQSANPGHADGRSALRVPPTIRWTSAL
jgi:hypothetical protein